jgi:hypothetical protein
MQGGRVCGSSIYADYFFTRPTFQKILCVFSVSSIMKRCEPYIVFCCNSSLLEFSHLNAVCLWCLSTEPEFVNVERVQEVIPTAKLHMLAESIPWCSSIEAEFVNVEGVQELIPTARLHYICWRNRPLESIPWVLERL